MFTDKCDANVRQYSRSFATENFHVLESSSTSSRDEVLARQTEFHIIGVSHSDSNDMIGLNVVTNVDEILFFCLIIIYTQSWSSLESQAHLLQ